MTISEIMEIMRAAVSTAIKLASPILVVSMAIGLIISIFQAATQIHEQTITFVPKLFAIIAILVLLGPWMMQVMSDFSRYIFELIANLN